MDDINHIKDQLRPQSFDGRFDAVICLGNSFPHLADSDGRHTDQRRALSNMYSLVRPGGLFIIDHRNYDEMIATGKIPANNIYYNVRTY
jgi:glycine N-methyltransferase